MRRGRRSPRRPAPIRQPFPATCRRPRARRRRRRRARCALGRFEPRRNGFMRVASAVAATRQRHSTPAATRLPSRYSSRSASTLPSMRPEQGKAQQYAVERHPKARIAPGESQNPPRSPQTGRAPAKSPPGTPPRAPAGSASPAAAHDASWSAIPRSAARQSRAETPPRRRRQPARSPDRSARQAAPAPRRGCVRRLSPRRASASPRSPCASPAAITIG